MSVPVSNCTPEVAVRGCYDTRKPVWAIAHRKSECAFGKERIRTCVQGVSAGDEVTRLNASWAGFRFAELLDLDVDLPAKLRRYELQYLTASRLSLDPDGESL